MENNQLIYASLSALGNKMLYYSIIYPAYQVTPLSSHAHLNKSAAKQIQHYVWNLKFCSSELS